MAVSPGPPAFAHASIPRSTSTGWQRRLPPSHGLEFSEFSLSAGLGNVYAPCRRYSPTTWAPRDTCYPCFDYEAYTVFIDGKQVISTTTSETKSHRFDDHTTFTVHFDDTRPHDLRVDYAHRATLFGAGLIMNWLPPAEALRKEAVAAAANADVVIAFAGLSSDLEGEQMSVAVDGFASGDRTRIALPKTQGALLDALYSTGKPVIVVLMNGSALAIPEAG